MEQLERFDWDGSFRETSCRSSESSSLVIVNEHESESIVISVVNLSGRLLTQFSTTLHISRLVES